MAGQLSPGGAKVRYAVYPFLGTASNGVHCSPLLNYKDNATLAVSRAIANSITDPDGITGSANAAPVVWRDPKYGEIDDICTAAGHTSLLGYQIQELYSNTQKKCVITELDFGLSASTPPTLASGSVRSTVSTTKIGVYPTQVTFSVSGLPAHVTAAFSPTQAPAGSSTGLTLTAASSRLPSLEFPPRASPTAPASF